jgi:hypoxanthine phosphoribosyltransferase
MEHQLREVFSAQEIGRRVGELGKEIAEHYSGEPVVAVCVLKGGAVFFADLLRRLPPETETDFVRLASYAGGTETTGAIRFLKDVDTDLKDRHVLVVEDVVDSGLTLRYLLEAFASRGPRSLKVCTLVDKHERRRTEVQVDFRGFNLKKGFIVGYGMDVAERYRGLDGIYEVVQDVGNHPNKDQQ